MIKNGQKQLEALHRENYYLKQHRQQSQARQNFFQFLSESGKQNSNGQGYGNKPVYNTPQHFQGQRA